MLTCIKNSRVNQLKSHSIRKILNVISLIISLLLFYGICEAQEKITICGTGDSQQLLRDLGTAFEKSHPGTIIDVPDSIGSSGGIRATADGKCDMGRVARPIKEKEKKYNLSYKLFALSPVVFVANASVTDVSSLTTEQIINIFSGKITNWSSLGKTDAKIYVANREAGDSSRTILEKHIPGFKEISEPAGKVIFSTPETVDTIMNYDGTLGYTSLASVANKNITIMKLDGIYPTEKNVKDGRYTLVSPLGIIWKGDLNGLALRFYDYIFSPEGTKIMSKHGVIPVE